MGRSRRTPRYTGAARGGAAHGRESLHLRREHHPMTGRSTAVRLARLGLPHARPRAGAVLLASLGIAGAFAGLGVRLAPQVAGVLGAWIAIAAAVAPAARGARPAQRAIP